MDMVRAGLARTRSALVDGIVATVSGAEQIDDTELDDIEALLIQADVGVNTATDLVDLVRHQFAQRQRGSNAVADLFEVLAAELKNLVSSSQAPFDAAATLATKPHVILVVGVNGVGKTTTIGKLAGLYCAAGRRVMVAACDTFRAAALDQLDVWASRAGADIVRSQSGADPAAVAFDAASAAVARGMDVLLVDTAGRLHTKVNLMEELKKIRRSLGKVLNTAPHETLLVVDATTGQNALAQARQFHASSLRNWTARQKAESPSPFPANSPSRYASSGSAREWRTCRLSIRTPS